MRVLFSIYIKKRRHTYNRWCKMYKYVISISMVQGVILYSFMLMISLLALVVGHDADYNDADPDHNMSMTSSRKLNY